VPAWSRKQIRHIENDELVVRTAQPGYEWEPTIQIYDWVVGFEVACEGESLTGDLVGFKQWVRDTRECRTDEGWRIEGIMGSIEVTWGKTWLQALIARHEQRKRDMLTTHKLFRPLRMDELHIKEVFMKAST